MNMIVESKFAVEASGLMKRYNNGVLAVDGISLNIASNTIYAMLGPNGAGKTTTFSILTTLLEPTSGTAHVLGYDVVRQANKVRGQIGVTFQETVLDKDITGRQALEFHGRLYRMDRGTRRDRIDELLALVELEDAADRLISTYSGGMKRRLELIRGLMTAPRMLFLDEPTLGLDPQSRARIGDYIRDMKEKQGLTVLLTTHYMEEAEKLADKVGIIDHGKILVEGTPAGLIEQMGADMILIQGSGDRQKFIAEVNALPFTEKVTYAEGVIQVGVQSGSRRLVEIVNLANDTGYRIDDVSIAKPGLGDVFLQHTGRQFRD